MANEQAPPHYKALWFKCWVTKKEDEWSDLTKEEIQELLYTAFLYVHGDSVPEFKDRMLSSLWKIYKHELDAGIKRYNTSSTNGRKGADIQGMTLIL